MKRVIDEVGRRCRRCTFCGKWYGYRTTGTLCVDCGGYQCRVQYLPACTTSAWLKAPGGSKIMTTRMAGRWIHCSGCRVATLGDGNYVLHCTCQECSERSTLRERNA